MSYELPCILMRGGTSRGPFFLADWLPQDPGVRDRMLLAALGSPHELQIDGLGGGNSLTSKVAIVSRSRHAGCERWMDSAAARKLCSSATAAKAWMSARSNLMFMAHGSW